MSTNRGTAASLITTTAAVSACLCAYLSAPAVGEDTDVGAPPALAPGQAPPLPKAGPLAQLWLSRAGLLLKIDGGERLAAWPLTTEQVLDGPSPLLGESLLPARLSRRVRS
jgi:hypothetical protein